MKLYIPYSPRSFDGILADAKRWLANQGQTEIQVVALVPEGETGPPGVEAITVASNGCPSQPIGPGWAVCNGGPTQVGYAAAQADCTQLNVQRDGVTVMFRPVIYQPMLVSVLESDGLPQYGDLTTSPQAAKEEALDMREAYAKSGIDWQDTAYVDAIVTVSVYRTRDRAPLRGAGGRK